MSGLLLDRLPLFSRLFIWLGKGWLVFSFDAIGYDLRQSPIVDRENLPEVVLSHNNLATWIDQPKRWRRANAVGVYGRMFPTTRESVATFFEFLFDNELDRGLSFFVHADG